MMLHNNLEIALTEDIVNNVSPPKSSSLLSSPSDKSNVTEYLKAVLFEGGDCDGALLLSFTNALATSFTFNYITFSGRSTLTAFGGGGEGEAAVEFDGGDWIGRGWVY